MCAITTALGKVLLAFQREPLRKDMLARIDFEKFTRRTLSDARAFEKHLTDVRKSRVAFDDEEFSVGGRCIAASVFKHDGLPASALGTSGPSPRITDDRFTQLADIVRREAQSLSLKIPWSAGVGTDA